MSIEEIKAALHTLTICEVYIPGSAYLDAGWYQAIIQCVDETCTVFLYCPDVYGGTDIRVQGRGESIQLLRQKNIISG